MASEIEYMVSENTLNPDFRIPISKDDFDELKKNKDRLSAALRLEIRYEMILNNYITMEKGLFSIIIDWNLNSQYEIYDDLTKNKIQVNTLLLNLLNVAISYQDHVKENIQELFGISNEQIKKIFDKPGYKFIKKFRNHQQHNIIVEGFVLPKLEIVNGSQEILGNVPCYLDLPKDKNDELLSLIPPDLKPKFKKDDRLNICPIINFCMDLHNKIHCEINDIINPIVQEARDYIEEYTNTYVNKSKEKYPDRSEEYPEPKLTAYAYTPGTRPNLLGSSCVTLEPHQGLNISDRVSLFLGWDDARDKLNKKNQQEFNLLNQKHKI